MTDQYGLRKEAILTFMNEHGIDLNDLDSVTSRGGQTEPIPGGTYKINEAMLEQVRSGEYGHHVCGIGVLVAYDLCNLSGWRFGIYSNSACTNLVSGPHSTNSSGKISVTDLTAGTYYVKELGHTDSAINAMYYCSSTNPQKVTVTAGSTATVSFANTMPALHEGYIPERSHDVLFDRRERTKSDSAFYTEFRCLDVQRDTFLSKPIPGDTDQIVFLVKIRVGEWDMKGLRIGYQLYGTVFEFFGSVDRRNDGECLLLRLAAKIPSAEVVSHKEYLPE